MQKLHMVGFTTDHRGLIFSVRRGAKSGGYVINVDASIIDRVLKLLQRQKVLVRVDTLVFHEGALKGLKSAVAALKSAEGNAARIDVWRAAVDCG